ncbi:MAG: hypothetical protein NZ898_07750 [Myxococcota bacterium]|nr:hypothetical protein [Myxococcota bacterium]
MDTTGSFEKLLVIASVAAWLGCGDDDDERRRDAGPPADAAPADATPGEDATGSDGPSTDGGACNVPIEEFPRRLAAVACQYFERCLGAPVVEVFVGPQCTEHFLGLIRNDTFGLIDEAVAAGRIRYDASRACACLDAFSRFSCDSEFGDAPPPECVAALEGTVAVGGACSIHEECQAGAFCRLTDSCPGTCTMRAAENQPCGDDMLCAFGLSCQGSVTGGESRCRMAARAGEPCGDSDGRECGGFLECQRTSPEGSGTCQPATTFTATEGMPCDIEDGVLCAEGLSCAFMRSTTGAPELRCVRREVGSDGSCVVSVPDVCGSDRYCNVSGMSFSGTCAPLPTAGQPCTPFGRCAPGHACVFGEGGGGGPGSGTCRRLQDNGGACTASRECYSSRCEDGRCEGPVYCTGR